MMRGIAEGAKVDFDDLLFLNTSIELTRGCTSYAAAGSATASGQPVLGMNADETNSVDRAIEVVEDGVRWNAMDPQSAQLASLSAIGDMTEANSLFSKNRSKRLGELTARYLGQLDAEARRTILGDHGDPNDKTHMRSMCMHPKHTDGKQTCASMVALPAERT